MHIQTILAFAILAITSVSCSRLSPKAAPAARPQQRSSPTHVPLPHRVAMGGPEFDNYVPVSIQERQQMAQIPFQFCPEFFGDAPKLCSLCGGDSNTPGICNDLLVSGDQSYCPFDGNQNACRGYYCQCTDGGTDTNPQVTSTTVVNGVTGTVIWEPLTLPQYTSLKASTTVTLSESATQTGDSEAETVVAVVFAAGVCWWVASQSGAAAAALLIQPPSQMPDGSQEDDPSCQTNPKEECPNCGGANSVGLCQSGPEAGCPCDEAEQQCPADGPPLCSDTSCGGDNGHSQCSAEGAINGCTCCPDDPWDCTDTNCGGDNTGKFLSDTFKGCGCEQTIGSQDVDTDGDVPDLTSDDLAAQVAFAFSSVWNADPSSVPGYSAPPAATPWCQHGAAPSQPRLPSEYCMCGPNGSIYYSVATGTNPCPYTAEPGPTITWTTPGADTTTTPPPPTTTPTTAPITTPTTTSTSSAACDPYWCGAPFCGPCP